MGKSGCLENSYTYGCWEFDSPVHRQFGARKLTWQDSTRKGSRSASSMLAVLHQFNAAVVEWQTGTP